MLLLAHRGASADAPENTLPAFEEAVRQSADGVELDAMVCGSGEVVVCHDDTLQRLAGVDWEVAKTPLRRLRELDVGGHLGFSRAGIPTLEEVFDVLPPHLLVNIELKCDTVEDRGLSVKVADWVVAQGHADRVLLSSFNPLCLIRAARAQPSLRRGFLIDPDKPLFAQTALYLPLSANHSVHPHFSQATPERVRGWKEAGYSLAVWTVDDAGEARRLESLGAAYCITNRPRALRDQLRHSSDGAAAG